MKKETTYPRSCHAQHVSVLPLSVRHRTTRLRLHGRHCSLLLLALAAAHCSAAAVDTHPRASHTASNEATQAATPDDFPESLFWPDTLDQTVKAPFSEEDGKAFAEKARSLRVTRLEEGCGRMKNRLATLEDGTRVCCRYRDNVNELRGDLYSYHLNGLLGLWNAPPTAAVKVDLSGKQWSGVREAAREAGWKERAVVLLSLYIDGLHEEHIPLLFKSGKYTLTSELFSNVSLTAEETKHLVQWTDMIVFDFVIGHTDRLFNILLNLKWNSHMMEKPVHNLKKTRSSDLVLLDNESGFWIGYTSGKQAQENYDLQAHFLKRLCVFRRQTIQALLKLSSVNGQPPSAVLEGYIQQVDPTSFSLLRRLKDHLQTEFNTRVKEIEKRLSQCASMV